MTNRLTKILYRLSCCFFMIAAIMVGLGPAKALTSHWPRTIQDIGTDPAAACAAAIEGQMFYDTDTGMAYVCDGTRNKWLSPHQITLWGDDTNDCASGNDVNDNDGCNVDWGNGLGPEASALGFYIPHDMTITGFGFSAEDDDCTTVSFDIEIFGSGANNDDNTFSLANGTTVSAGETGETANATNLDLDVDGDQYIMWGLDNNCGQTINDWNVVLYARWRHD